MKPLTKIFPNGFTLELPAYYPQFAYWYLDSERETQKWLCDNVKPDWECVEVGAHIGYTSILLASLGRHVASFEANTRSARMFRINLLHNESRLKRAFNNIELYNYAVGNQSGPHTETLYLTGEEGEFGKTESEFEFVTLDEVLLDYNKIEELHLIFVDADGWDYDVLLGSAKLIEKFHPFIVLEANYALAWRQRSVHDVLDFAHKFSYEYKWLDKDCPGNMLLC